MKLFKKNQLVITTLAGLIAVAGYLNHVERAEKEGSLAGVQVEESTKEGESVDGDIQPAEDVAVSDIESNDVEMSGEPGEALLVNAAGNVEFIVEAKLAREEVRANNKAALMEIVNNEKLTQEEKKAAVDQVVKLTENAEKEAAAENMIQAKGYENVAVTITDEGVDVMVVTEELTDVQRAQIEEIVKTKANVTADKITITAVKNIQK